MIIKWIEKNVLPITSRIYARLFPYDFSHWYDGLFFGSPFAFDIFSWFGGTHHKRIKKHHDPIGPTIFKNFTDHLLEDLDWGTGIMVYQNEFYGGSLYFEPLADKLGVQVDQVNFMICQISAFILAIPFRTYLSAKSVGANTRHIVEIVVGVLLTLFCFGDQIKHLVVQSMVGYMLMALGSDALSHHFVFVWSMGYLSVCHIYRQIYDYGGYTLDITGPLMIQTQKLTALAYALYDGTPRRRDHLSEDQKKNKVTQLPSLMEFLSYMFYFHGIMVGPTTFYNDYIEFINGRNLLAVPPTSIHPADLNTRRNTTSFLNLMEYVANNQRRATENLNWIVSKKLLTAAACCAGMMILPGIFFPPEKLNSPEFYTWSYFYKMIFILGCLTLAKQKYYFAWVFGDCVNNAAGYGFSGYDSNGKAKWDLTNNVDIKGVELSSSLNININSWNTKTTVWLRRVVYDRMPKAYSTFGVFAVSALWHGFYPGYYFTFLGGAFFIATGRLVRRRLRPYFTKSPVKKLYYDALTFTVTRFSNAYLCFPFLVLTWKACLKVYLSLYFSLHIICLIVYIVMLLLPTPRDAHRERAHGTTVDDVSASSEPEFDDPNTRRKALKPGRGVGNVSPGTMSPLSHATHREDKHDSEIEPNDLRRKALVKSMTDIPDDDPSEDPSSKVKGRHDVKGQGTSHGTSSPSHKYDFDSTQDLRRRAIVKSMTDLPDDDPSEDPSAHKRKDHGHGHGHGTSHGTHSPIHEEDTDDAHKRKDHGHGHGHGTSPGTSHGTSSPIHKDDTDDHHRRRAIVKSMTDADDNANSNVNRNKAVESHGTISSISQSIEQSASLEDEEDDVDDPTLIRRKAINVKSIGHITPVTSNEQIITHREERDDYETPNDLRRKATVQDTVLKFQAQADLD